MYGKFGMASVICSVLEISACMAQRPYKYWKSSLKFDEKEIDRFYSKLLWQPVPAFWVVFYSIDANASCSLQNKIWLSTIKILFCVVQWA